MIAVTAPADGTAVHYAAIARITGQLGDNWRTHFRLGIIELLSLPARLVNGIQSCRKQASLTVAY